MLGRRAESSAGPLSWESCSNGPRQDHPPKADFTMMGSPGPVIRIKWQSRLQWSVKPSPGRA
jgi:hypothetical protein